MALTRKINSADVDGTEMTNEAPIACITVSQLAICRATRALTLDGCEAKHTYCRCRLPVCSMLVCRVYECLRMVQIGLDDRAHLERKYATTTGPNFLPPEHILISSRIDIVHSTTKALVEIKIFS
jgi:hypothetical protein